MPEVPVKKVSWPSRKAFAEDVVKNLLDLGLQLPASQILTAHIALSTGWGRAADNYRLAGIKCPESLAASVPYTVNRGFEHANGEKKWGLMKFRAYSSLREGLQAILRLLQARRYIASRSLLLAGNRAYFKQLGLDGWYTAPPEQVEADCLSRLALIEKWTTPAIAPLMLFAGLVGLWCVA